MPWFTVAQWHEARLLIVLNSLYGSYTASSLTLGFTSTVSSPLNW